MKKLKRMAVVLAAAMSLLVTGCAQEFDAKGYVQGDLDAVLKGEISEDYLKLVDSTEEEIRTEARRVCETYAPGGHFIPCITYGGPGCLYKHVDPIINDEIDKYNKKVYGV